MNTPQVESLKDMFEVVTVNISGDYQVYVMEQDCNPQSYPAIFIKNGGSYNFGMVTATGSIPCCIAISGADSSSDEELANEIDLRLSDFVVGFKSLDNGPGYLIEPRVNVEEEIDISGDAYKTTVSKQVTKFFTVDWGLEDPG